MAETQRAAKELPIWNANKGSFIDLAKLELQYPRIRSLVRQRGLSAHSFGAVDHDDRIPVEIFDQKAKEHGLTQLHYYLNTHDGAVSKKELEAIINAKNMNDVIDQVQRRKRRFLDLSLNTDDEKKESRQIRSVSFEGTYPSLGLMDHLRNKVIQRHGELFPQFRMFDQDNDGYISKKEFMNFAQTNIGFNDIQSSALFDNIAGGKNSITHNDFFRKASPVDDLTSNSQPSAEYTRKLASKCSEAFQRKQTERLLESQADQPHIMKPVPSSRTSAWPGYLTANTFASVMARTENSVEVVKREEIF